jgi:hypothetical protein
MRVRSPFRLEDEIVLLPSIMFARQSAAVWFIPRESDDRFAWSPEDVAEGWKQHETAW